MTFANFLSDLELHAGKHGGLGAGGREPSTQKKRVCVCRSPPPQWEIKLPRLWDMQIIREHPRVPSEGVGGSVHSGAQEEPEFG